MDHVELSIYRNLPPLLLFLLIAPIIVLTTQKGWLSVITALVVLVLTKRDKDNLSRVLFAIPLLYMTYYIAEEDADHWYMGIKLAPVLIACVAAVAVLYQEVTHKKKDAHAVRTLVYYITITICAIVGMLYARELVRLMEEDHTLTIHLTTVRNNCTHTTVSSILFDDTPFNVQCPIRVWEHIRINIMLGVQLYVMYTLTTSLQNSIKHSDDKYTVGALIVTECLMWTLASALQFDVIEDCYRLTTTTVICVTLAAVCNVFIHAFAVSKLPHAANTLLISHKVHSAAKLKL